MNETIMIVEDEIRMRIIIRDYLKKEGFKVVEATNGKEAVEFFMQNPVDLIILDIMMPLLDGFQVCRKVREISSVPIIILTARSEEDDKLTGYDIGADDYMTKPFSPKILVAKVKALLKRYSKESSSQDILEIDGLKINKLAKTVSIYGKEVNLTPKEYELLVYLSDNKTVVLDRDSILNKVWGFDYYGDARVVDTTIKRLREKLKDKACFIATVRGRGYKFEVKDEEQNN
ncbi:response regulator transcription factor [Clostridium polynesiense]|uniref:response regulator transcription factor n=1 Tax=Clostridium polynesiense TaxID=1325933 RepID=UPI00058C22FD|nr:response regulator transcription factor [Clostridium polynesiense]